MPIPVPNSSTGGYLVPDSNAPPPYAPPLQDSALMDLFHDVIAGVVGFDQDAAHKALVRPRDQEEPPNEPDIDTDWLSFGLTFDDQDWDRVEIHDPNYYGADGGATITQQDQEMVLLVSYFGPNAGSVRSRFEAGIKVAQNREALEQYGIKFAGAVGSAYRLPALLKDTRWRNRWDQKFRFRRRLSYVYPILNIASASVNPLDNEQYKTVVNVPLPPP